MRSHAARCVARIDYNSICLNGIYGTVRGSAGRCGRRQFTFRDWLTIYCYQSFSGWVATFCASWNRLLVVVADGATRGII
jgi:hypothetical protein